MHVAAHVRDRVGQMHPIALKRRELLQLVAVTTAGACMPAAPSADAGVSCSAASEGTSAQYCLAQGLLVRVPAAVALAVGEAVLLNVDDNTGVIVARDAGGLHALSAICTHACCLVSLCGDSACSQLSVSPRACSSTDVAAGDQQHASAVCPCHGSLFRLSDGAALTGPATTALPAYQLSIDGDDVVVDTGARVDASARV